MAQSEVRSRAVRREQAVVESRPFFLTSEFWGVGALVAAAAIGAAVTDSVDARLFWPLATALTIGFVFSRGLAKTNVPSRFWDPREELLTRDGDSEGGGSRRFAAARAGEDATHMASDRYEEETRQMSTMQREEYGQQQPGQASGPGYGAWGGYGRGWGMRQQYPIETKPFFLTSEFWGSVALIVGLAIAAGSSDGIDDRLFWILAAAITIGYVLSRGIAKSGTKSRSWDPREDLIEKVRDRGRD